MAHRIVAIGNRNKVEITEAYASKPTMWKVSRLDGSLLYVERNKTRAVYQLREQISLCEWRATLVDIGEFGELEELV